MVSSSSGNRRVRRSCANFRDVFVFLRRVAADPHRADHFALEADWNAALPRRCTRQSQSRDSPVLDLIFKFLAGPPKDRGRPRLADANFDARNLSVVQPLEYRQMTAIFHHRNYQGRLSFQRFGLGRCRDLLRDIQSQDRFYWQLRAFCSGRQRECQRACQ